MSGHGKWNVTITPLAETAARIAGVESDVAAVLRSSSGARGRVANAIVPHERKNATVSTTYKRIPLRRCFPRRTIAGARLIALCVALGAEAASPAGIYDEDWPASWSEAPRTASELGIENYSESPLLAKRVAAGELPPVEQRLPEDPIVVQPYDTIGRYGGTDRKSVV